MNRVLSRSENSLLEKASARRPENQKSTNRHVSDAEMKEALAEMLAGVSRSAHLSAQERQLWEKLDKDPSAFWHNRVKKSKHKGTKQAHRCPDFVHKKNPKLGGLWLSNKPEWVSLDGDGPNVPPQDVNSSRPKGKHLRPFCTDISLDCWPPFLFES